MLNKQRERLFYNALHVQGERRAFAAAAVTTLQREKRGQIGGALRALAIAARRPVSAQREEQSEGRGERRSCASAMVRQSAAHARR